MKFAIVEDKKDKWSRYKDVPVGAVYLLKTATEEQSETSISVIAYNTVCPHLGCFVDYRKKSRIFSVPAMIVILI